MAETFAGDLLKALDAGVRNAKLDEVEKLITHSPLLPHVLVILQRMSQCPPNHLKKYRYFFFLIDMEWQLPPFWSMCTLTTATCRRELRNILVLCVKPIGCYLILICDCHRTNQLSKCRPIKTVNALIRRMSNFELNVIEFSFWIRGFSTIYMHYRFIVQETAFKIYTGAGGGGHSNLLYFFYVLATMEIG